MIRAGIVTFQGSNNCGSLLQAYALQKYLMSKLEFDTEIINFSNKNQKEMYAIFNKNNRIKKVIKNLLCLPYYNLLKTHNNDYTYFVNRYLNLSSESYENSNEMADVENNYDIFIAGSDQIWNIKCYDADDAYFLNFIHHKPKIAYAPSLGAVDINKNTEESEKYKRYICDFKYLSVRERNGKKWIEDLTQRNVSILPDPTLLMPKEFWESLIGDRIISGDYIFYYAFNYPREISKKLRKLSKKMNMPIIMMDAKPWLLRGPKMYGFNITHSSGPLAFLNVMKHAKYVITTSLHGTIFSSIFEKNFWYLKGVLFNENDDRSSFLLEQLNLQSRLIEVENLDIHRIEISPNYETTRNKISMMQNDANHFWGDIKNELW